MNIFKSFFLMSSLILSHINCMAASQFDSQDSDGPHTRSFRQTHICDYEGFTQNCDGASHSIFAMSQRFSQLTRCLSGSLQGRTGSLVITIMRSLYNPGFVVHVIDEKTGLKNNRLFSSECDAAGYASATYAV